MKVGPMQEEIAFQDLRHDGYVPPKDHNLELSDEVWLLAEEQREAREVAEQAAAVLEQAHRQQDGFEALYGEIMG